MPVILATQEAEIRRIRANSSRDPILKIPIIKRGLVKWLKVEALISTQCGGGGKKKSTQ
jgi:hypothetical protein